MILRECYKVIAPGATSGMRIFDYAKAQAMADEMRCLLLVAHVLEWPTERGVLYFELNQVSVVDA